MFKVKVYDHGWVTMCESYEDDVWGFGWKDCVFKTKEEAEKALQDYLDTWSDERYTRGYVYEV